MHVLNAETCTTLLTRSDKLEQIFTVHEVDAFVCRRGWEYKPEHVSEVSAPARQEGKEREVHKE